MSQLSALNKVSSAPLQLDTNLSQPIPNQPSDFIDDTKYKFEQAIPANFLGPNLYLQGQPQLVQQLPGNLPNFPNLNLKLEGASLVNLCAPSYSLGGGLFGPQLKQPPTPNLGALATLAGNIPLPPQPKGNDASSASGSSSAMSSPGSQSQGSLNAGGQQNAVQGMAINLPALGEGKPNSPTNGTGTSSAIGIGHVCLCSLSFFIYLKNFMVLKLIVTICLII